MDKIKLEQAADATIVQSDTVVLYHRDCFDGFCAAWLMHKIYPNAIYIGVNYGEEPPPQCEGRYVFIVDFSYKLPVLLKLQEIAKQILILDHHKTAQEDLKDIPYAVFDMNKSGARLVQEHFKLPNNWLIDYTEDRDLWKWQLEDSKIINAGLRLQPMIFEHWDKLENPINIQPIKLTGTAIVAYETKVIKDHVKHVKQIIVKGHKVPAVYATTLQSEIGNALLADGAPFSLVTTNGKKFSLRSNGFDVSEIAAHFGGGGHKQAAGFELPQAIYLEENLEIC